MKYNSQCSDKIIYSSAQDFGTYLFSLTAQSVVTTVVHIPVTWHSAPVTPSFLEVHLF